MLALSPLSEQAAVRLVHTITAHQTTDGLAQACARAAGGNPFYLTQLVDELQVEGLELANQNPDRVMTFSPTAVRRSVLLRLVRLGPDALRLAEAVATLGDACSLASAAELASLDRPAAVAALDGLAATDILRPAEPLGFVHPLVASSVHDEIPVGRRGEMHLAAARLLEREGADHQAVGGQLMAAGRRGEEWTVDALRRAASLALRRAAPGTAAAFLSRALEEPPSAQLRPAVLADLARAESAAGWSAAAGHFETLLGLVSVPGERAAIHLELGRCLAVQGHHSQALEAFERGLAEQGQDLDETGRELRSAYWMEKTMTARLTRPELGQLQDLVGAELQTPTPGERALLARLAMGAAFSCQPREQVVELARRAWGDGALLASETSDGTSWTLITGALLFADELELVLDLCEQALADARRRGSPLGFATASFIRAGPLALLGRNDEAIADLESALAAREDGWSQYLGTCLGWLCRARLDRGDVAGARQAIEVAQQDPELVQSIEHTVILSREGELLLDEGKPAEALERLETAGRLLQPTYDFVIWAPWRPGAIRALLALERKQRARDLAEEMVSHTRRLGSPTALAHALRMAAMTHGGRRGLDLLEEAVALFEGRPQRYQHAHALVEYGAGLRRSGRRAAARGPLRQGLGLAEAGGLSVLAHQALQELAAAGARTRPHTLSGVRALTPSERRVVELAASDLSNRDIAQQLFVTIKTVEYHLANAYRKLDVRSRAGLAAALSAADGSGQS